MGALSFLNEKGFDVTSSYSHGGMVISVWSEDYEAARSLLEARSEYTHVLQPQDSKVPWERVNRTSKR